MARPDAPVAFKDRRVIGVLLVDAQQVMLAVGPNGRVLQMCDIGHRVQFRDRIRHPVHAGLAVDVEALRKKPAAGLGPLVGKDDPRARATGCQRRDQARCTCTDDNDIGVGVARLEMARPGRLGGGRGKTRGLADGGFEKVPGRPFERLVVEPRRDEGSDHLVERANVEFG